MATRDRTKAANRSQHNLRPVLISVKEAAVLLDVSVPQMYRILKAKPGFLPIFDLGPRSTRIPLAALEALGQTAKTAPEQAPEQLRRVK